jgi:endonuclease-3
MACGEGRVVKRAEKAARVQATLDALFPDPPIPLDHEDPFTLLVAVVLSAQCTDARVNTVTPALFRMARTPEAMAAQDVEAIRDIIRPCGLSPTKARNLQALSEILARDHGGAVPRELDVLERLPGVGHKTASVVAAQAFGAPTFPVDTHIHRLAWRWGLASGRNVSDTERSLKAAFPKASWNRLHLQFIYFGRAHCPARGHDPQICPICAWAGIASRLRQEASGGGRKPRRKGKPRKTPAD